MNKKLYILVAVALAMAALVIIFRFVPVCVNLLEELAQQKQWLLLVVAVAALVDSINPCAFSVLLLTIAFLFSLGAMRARILRLAGLYIFGIFIVYWPTGLGSVKTLALFSGPHFMAKAAAALLIIFGAINLANEFFPSFPVKLKIPASAHGVMARLMNKASAPGAFLLGMLVGLCEFPCTGGPYLMVLGLLHDQETYAQGLVYLILYNLIFVLPLVVILIIGSNHVVLAKIDQLRKSNMGHLKLWSGLAMVALGVVMLVL